MSLNKEDSFSYISKSFIPFNHNSRVTLSVSIEDLLQNPNIPVHPESLYTPIRYTLSMGGKRIRPKLVLISCGLCNGNPEMAMQAAVAVETLHNFTLIHDDIMDNADTRRGFQTVHKKWDTSTAILSGDALFAYSFEMLNYYGKNDAFSKEQYFQLNRIFLEATRIVCEGQARDMDFENRSDVNLDEYLLMIEQKTAALLKASLMMGAVVANASEHAVQTLGEIGRKIGLAFQIQDDLLDAIGDPSKFGKKPGGDIIEGKKTYLSIKARQAANEDDKQLLAEILSRGAKSDSEVSAVIEIYHRTKVIEETYDEISTLYMESKQLLNEFEDSGYKNEINTLLNLLIIREN